MPKRAHSGKRNSEKTKQSNANGNKAERQIFRLSTSLSRGISFVNLCAFFIVENENVSLMQNKTHQNRKKWNDFRFSARSWKFGRGNFCRLPLSDIQYTIYHTLIEALRSQSGLKWSCSKHFKWVWKQRAWNGARVILILFIRTEITIRPLLPFMQLALELIISNQLISRFHCSRCTQHWPFHWSAKTRWFLPFFPAYWETKRWK